MRTLGEIVSAALSGAETSMKVASARDAQPKVPDGGLDDFLAQELAIPSVAASAPSATPEEKTVKSASIEEIRADAEKGVKLAEALDLASQILVKQAASKAPGQVQTMVSGHQETAPVAKPHANSLDKTTASSGGGPVGPQGKIKDTMGDYSTSNWTKNKEAAANLIRAKIAQADQLREQGQLQLAQQALQEAQEIQKQAQDPSSPPPSLPAQSTSFKLNTDPGSATHIPDNAGMATLTKAQAKDSTVREAGARIMEQPKKDNVPAAVVGKTTGQKLSSVQVGAAKELAKRAALVLNDPNSNEADRTKAASVIEVAQTRTQLTLEQLLS